MVRPIKDRVPIPAHLKAWVDKTFPELRATIIKDGGLQPAYIFFKGEELYDIFPVPPGTDKYVACKFAGHLVAKFKFDAVIFVSDSWVKSVDGDKEPLDTHTPVSQQAGRKEAIMFMVQTFNPNHTWWTYVTYDRAEDDSIIMGSDLPEFNEDLEMKGALIVVPDGSKIAEVDALLSEIDEEEEEEEEENNRGRK